MPGQVVAYVRVSSEDQHLDRQRASLRDAVGDPDRWFEDRCSGGSTNRPGLDALLAHVREGDEIVVPSMDRLARSVPDLYALVDGLRARGVAVRFLKEGQRFEPGANSSMSRLLLGVLGAVAEFEPSLIRERQAEGIAQAKARGVYQGRSRRLSPEQVIAARERVAGGVPLSRVAREAGVSRSVMNDAVKGRGAYASESEVD
ncbi:recombinase family protein [Kocuria soli]|uniref:Recombinase family protein n=1 Tax=Kocuria soli TaxID=2485125 RepID=A0A3N4A416_9MICC|nr:recombinase family protein [Kocuria soli]ROZ63298.1 recombinase family protein [Kocuria soli]